MGPDDIKFVYRPTTFIHKRIKIIIFCRMRYIHIANPITSDGMLPGSAAIVDASIVRPIVSFKEKRMIPVIIFRIIVICIITIFYKIIMENKVVARRTQIDTIFGVVWYCATAYLTIWRTKKIDTILGVVWYYRTDYSVIWS